MVVAIGRHETMAMIVAALTHTHMIEIGTEIAIAIGSESETVTASAIATEAVRRTHTSVTVKTAYGFPPFVWPLLCDEREY